MRFKYDGISVDLSYAQLKVMSVPDNMDVLNPFILENIDETSWKCLSGVRANMQILQLVPNLEKFQLVLRCLKLWARRLRSILQRMGNFHFL
ncbi:nuclear poly(A) polymerase 3-like isoform X1 [Papaver somniferum]|uniref:nuclear poly(A) polymerase 3-like isoform X1 n=1 Tax=Papaver somniferum TaxID=3469 RepID=UPI000E6FA0AD|nr:nuclear poly(A) polymerase 3-like isoform X1 [Papaver somniferum]